MPKTCSFQRPKKQFVSKWPETSAASEAPAGALKQNFPTEGGHTLLSVFLITAVNHDPETLTHSISVIPVESCVLSDTRQKGSLRRCNILVQRSAATLIPQQTHTTPEKDHKQLLCTYSIYYTICYSPIILSRNLEILCCILQSCCRMSREKKKKTPPTQ